MDKRTAKRMARFYAGLELQSALESGWDVGLHIGHPDYQDHPDAHRLADAIMELARWLQATGFPAPKTRLTKEEA